MYCRDVKDETLVLLTLAGDQTAYEELVVRYQRAVISSALSVTKNGFMAEDAAQDAFVTAWIKLNTLQEPQKYSSWVCRIAKNCAINMINRYQSFLPLDVVDNLSLSSDVSDNPAELYDFSEEREYVNKSVDLLPERVRQTIYLHYYEGLSIAEVADRMRVSEGTVKRQLHDGRKMIRKELCAMNEKYSDTLVERVMKKVEELKLWQIRNDKSGFEAVYKDVLREVELLPECKEKNHALSDVLMRGWWWLPGEKNDALFERIVNAATEGKNEEVMTFIVGREDSRIYGSARIDFMRDKQIPRLEKAGFVKTLGREWFWLGIYLCREGKRDEGYSAFEKVEEILGKNDIFRILVPYAKTANETLLEHYKDIPKERYHLSCSVKELRKIDGAYRYYKSDGFGEGHLASLDRESKYVFYNASCCDGRFFADIALGESCIASDGTELTYVSDNNTVQTEAGIFDGCQLWETRRWTDVQKIVCRTYYKDGVGIVRQEHKTDGITVSQTLSRYEIKGGKGLLPLFEGNLWEYDSSYPSDIISSVLTVKVSYADEEKVLLSCYSDQERLAYDEASWVDTVQEIANEYCYDTDSSSHLRDIYSVIERAERLASTPMEKAHTRAAAAVARRILETDVEFNPEYTATGHWNFFGREYLRKKGDTVCITDYNPRWSFEWKSMGGMHPAEDPMLYSDIFGILQDAANCVWSNEWQVGASPIVEYVLWDNSVKTKINCSDGGTVTTKAGTFENCFKLSLEISGFEKGLSYRSGKKVYYFADGIGIVRTENEYCGGAKTAVYELTSYEGTGDGYMPLKDGLFRRYDALGLTDGFVGSVEYEFVADEDGDIVVFGNQTGIRELPPPITQYNSIEGEMAEQRLFDENKWQEGHIKYAANNFHIFLHLLARPSRNRNNARRSVELNGFYMRFMEGLGQNGEVPPAWYGLYAWTALAGAAALFGDGKKEGGYSMLETVLEYCMKLSSFKKGDMLDTGNEEVLGGIKYIYKKSLIQLPDGTLEPTGYGYRMSFNAGDFLSCLTAPHGWWWFNSVRDEDRFKHYIEKARNMSVK